MSLELQEYRTQNGEMLLYTGNPNFQLLESLALGPGDLWHSSKDQGYKDSFQEIMFQTAVFWWFLNDIKDSETAVNWRINPYSFVVRKEVWKIFNGFPLGYESEIMSAFDFGYRLLRHGGGVPLYIKGLFSEEQREIKISPLDRYTFYLKNFKTEHSVYMLLKKGKIKPFSEGIAFLKAKKRKPVKNNFPILPARALEEIHGNPLVSVILPTMYRQDFTLQLLKDYENQTFAVKEVIVVDATPIKERDEAIYDQTDFNFDLKVIWQKSKGSARARNEAIDLSRGEYIIFADDDTRILPDFVENHIRFLQTYQVAGCNGLDITAADHRENLDDLRQKLVEMGPGRWKAGAAHSFSNANSCVRREWVQELIGNDINFDGGYGEDSDFGFRIFRKGGLVLFNPYAVNLHLKPPAGGFRHWGKESSLIGKKRRPQAWELGHPVRWIKPVPSPTVLYGIMKHYNKQQVQEYRSKYIFLYLFKKSKAGLPLRILKLPLKLLQFGRSAFYANNLINKGERF